MTVTRILATILLAAAACSGAAPAPEPQVPEGPERAVEPSPDAQRIATALDPYYASYGSVLGDAYAISGHVHIERAGEVLYSRGFGFADRDAGRRTTADTSFRIGSVTKQFTAAAILELAERGALSVTDPIRKHLPDYPAPAGDTVTIHHLLTHTSGIPSYTDMPEVMERRDRAMTTEELIATFRDQPLQFEPGTRFAYSNSGYALLGAILEAVTGSAYAELMAEIVFAPAGLEDTTVGDASDARDRAIGYATTPAGAVERARSIDMSVPYAAGAIRSTVRDMVRWHRYLADGGLLDPDSLRAMYTPSEASTVAGPLGPQGYGYGWTVVHAVEKDRMVLSHGGGIDGFSAAYIRVPADDLVIVAWTNNPVVPAGPLADVALITVYGGTVPARVEKPRVSLDAAAAARLVGSYVVTDAARSTALAAGLPETALDRIAEVEIRTVADTIALAVPGRGELPLSPESDRIFTATDAGIRVEFTFDGDGPATGMTITQAQLTLPYARKP